MLRMIILVMLLAVINVAHAITEARLIRQSSSGQTALFNLGIHDGVKEGDYAVILKEIRPLDVSDLRVVPVARARNVKIYADSSVWILYKIHDHELLIKNDPFLILSESDLLRGRRMPKMGRISVVTEKDKTHDQTKAFLEDDADQLSRLKHKYQKIETLKQPKLRSDSDVQLVDVDKWKDVGDRRYRSALYRSPHKDEFVRQHQLATFEKMVGAYLLKVNDPNFNYDRFYEEQRKENYAHEFRVKTNFDTEYTAFLRRQSAKASSDAKLYRAILEQGESWSENFSDEELRRVLNEVSMLQEKDRRDLILAKPKRFAAALDYGYYLNDAQNSEDPYRRNARYAIEGEMEAIPLLNHPTFEHFTVNATVRMNRTALEISSFNSDLNEYSATLGVNWYPLYKPYAVEAAVLFLGTYIRSGFAQVISPTAGERANYTLSSMPGFRGGMKYLMRNNFGVRLMLSMESVQLDRYESSRFNALLADRTSYVEGKFSVGLAYAF
jgi:hypothetical protein